MMAQSMTEMGEQLDARMKRIEDALNVDEALQAKEQEIEELHEKILERAFTLKTIALMHSKISLACLVTS